MRYCIRTTLRYINAVKHLLLVRIAVINIDHVTVLALNVNSGVAVLCFMNRNSIKRPLWIGVSQVAAQAVRYVRRVRSFLGSRAEIKCKRHLVLWNF